MENVQNKTPEVTLVKGITRRFPIQACTFSEEDLRKLYGLLQEKVNESTEKEISKLTQLPRPTNQTEEQFQKFVEDIRFSSKLVVTVRGAEGDWFLGTTLEVLRTESLPDTIANIEYNSTILFRNRFQREPPQSLIVNLDFSRVNVLDLTSPASASTPNASAVFLAGSDITWVNGVHEQLRSFFCERAKRYNWLHSNNIYDLLLLFIGFPASFDWVYKINLLLQKTPPVLPAALLVAIYVYVVLFTLYVFRILFNYTRWLFPKVEGPSVRRGPWNHRAIWGTFIFALLSSGFYDLVKKFLLR